MAKKKSNPLEETTETVAINETSQETTSCECEPLIATSSNFTYGFEESLVMDDVSERNLYINGEITADVFHHIYYFITKFNAEDIGIEIDKRRPIKLHISTQGGNVWDGLGICEIISN